MSRILLSTVPDLITTIVPKLKFPAGASSRFSSLNTSRFKWYTVYFIAWTHEPNHSTCNDTFPCCPRLVPGTVSLCPRCHYYITARLSFWVHLWPSFCHMDDSVLTCGGQQRSSQASRPQCFARSTKLYATIGEFSQNCIDIILINSHHWGLTIVVLFLSMERGGLCTEPLLLNRRSLLEGGYIPQWNIIVC